MSSSNCCFLTCIQVSQEAGQVVWYSHLFQNFPEFVVVHTVKGFDIVNKAEIDVFWNCLAFSMIKSMLATWSLVSLPFLKLAWTSESSRFMYCWSLGVVRGKNVSKTTLFLHTSTVQGYFWRIMQSCIRSEWWEFEQLMWNLTSALTEFCCCYCSVAKSCPTLWDPMNCSTPGFPVLHCLRSVLKLMSIESVMSSNHLILYHPHLLLPSILPSIRDFSNELALCIR